MNPLVEALQNVRSGRLALKLGAVDAGRYHLHLARYWWGKARGQAMFVGNPNATRCERTLSWINKFALEVMAAEPERISERYESQAIAESGPGEVE